MTVRRMRTGVAALALVGAGIAAYLTWVHFAGLRPVCAGGSGGCERVQSSPYAEFGGVPVALLGLIGYLAVLASLLPSGARGRSVTVFLALAGAGFSAYLTYLELAVIDAICQWCVASALVMAALAGVSVAYFLAAEPMSACVRTIPDETGGATRDAA
jgi:uncharacterized membrane protein